MSQVCRNHLGRRPPDGIAMRCESCRWLNIFLPPDSNGKLRFGEYKVIRGKAPLLIDPSRPKVNV